MAFAFHFRQELYGDWKHAQGYLIEQLDRLFANLSILTPLTDALGVSSGYTASAILATNTTGVPALTALLPMPLAFGTAVVLTPLALTANTDNYAPTGIATAAIVRLSATGAVDLTGLQAVASNMFRLLVNVGAANTITIKHASAASTAANRFRCAGAADVALTVGAARWAWYDAVATVWQVI